MKKTATPIETIEIKKHMLDIIKVESSKFFTGHALANLSINKRYGPITDTVVYTLQTMVPAEHMKTATHKFTISYPATWWQMFKDQYFPEWLKKHFLVRYETKEKTVKFDALALYPKMPKIFECGEYKQIILTREGGE